MLSLYSEGRPVEPLHLQNKKERKNAINIRLVPIEITTGIPCKDNSGVIL